MVVDGPGFDVIRDAHVAVQHVLDGVDVVGRCVLSLSASGDQPGRAAVEGGIMKRHIDAGLQGFLEVQGRVPDDPAHRDIWQAIGAPDIGVGLVAQVNTERAGTPGRHDLLLSHDEQMTATDGI